MGDLVGVGGDVLAAEELFVVVHVADLWWRGRGEG